MDVSQSLNQVQAAPLVIVTSNLDDGTVGVQYSDQVVATGGVAPYIWAISTGSLPSGVSLNGATGEISGTPLSSGTSNVSIEVTDSQLSSVNKSFSIVIAEPSIDPAITSVSPNQGGKNQRLTVTISGTSFSSGASVDFGAGIAAQSVDVVSSTQINVRIRVNKKASYGFRNVTVTNTDGGSDTLTNGFEVR